VSEPTFTPDSVESAVQVAGTWDRAHLVDFVRDTLGVYAAGGSGADTVDGLALLAEKYGLAEHLVPTDAHELDAATPRAATMVFRNFYVCPDPECGAEWEDVWDSAVNGQCPGCQMKDITPTRSEPVA
jgi:hypothetical protein